MSMTTEEAKAKVDEGFRLEDDYLAGKITREQYRERMLALGYDDNHIKWRMSRRGN